MGSRSARRKKRKENRKTEFERKRRITEEKVDDVFRQQFRGFRRSHQKRQYDRDRDAIKTTIDTAKTAKLVAGDLSDTLHGRRRRLDKAGREKKRFWERDRFKSRRDQVIAAAGLTAAVAGISYAVDKEGTKQVLRKKMQQAASIKDPRVRKRVWRAILRNGFRRGTGVDPSAFFEGRQKLIEFFDRVEPERRDWQIQRISQRRAVVRSPDSKQRDRRPKKWHERKANRDKIIAGSAATLGGTLASAATALTLIHRGGVKPRLSPNLVRATRKRRRAVVAKARELRSVKQRDADRLARRRAADRKRRVLKKMAQDRKTGLTIVRRKNA